MDRSIRVQWQKTGYHKKSYPAHKSPHKGNARPLYGLLKATIKVTMKNIVGIIFYIFITGWLLTPCISGHCQSVDSMSLKAYAPVPVGVAIGYEPMLHNQAYQNVVSTDFDHVTFEYALKNGAIVRPDGSFDYRKADILVNTCRAKGLNIYGHTLCWYQNNSPFMASLKGDSTAIEHFLKKYITTTISRYRNSIHAWDVVNEAINSSGKLRINGRERRDYFYWGQYLKAGYIARAFRYAHAADPKAKLFYNDYNLETDPAKLNAVVNLVERLKKQGVPIDGVGTQLHMSINTPAEGIDNAFRQLASTGLLVRISELDIKLNPSNDPDFVITKQLLKRQGRKCRQVLSAYFKYVPAGQRFGITFWNVGEKDSWIVKGSHHTDSPTLFDGHYRPKPMYFMALDYFKNKGTTKAN